MVKSVEPPSHSGPTVYFPALPTVRSTARLYGLGQPYALRVLPRLTSLLLIGLT